MRDLVDRELELAALRAAASTPPALIVMRGRRRVGKSHLLRVAFAGDRVISLQAEQQPVALQLEAFATAASALLDGAPPLRFASWDQALTFVEQQAAHGPVTVILDEFQYLGSADPSLVSLIQRTWDRWDAQQAPIVIVLCGSALSFMEGMLSASSPTFGRSSYRPLLQPLTYRDAAGFASSDATPAQKIERFALLGGTPQYHRWAGARSTRAIVSEVMLSPGAPLYAEPRHLVREELEIRDAAPYFGVLQAVARGRTRPGEVASLLQIREQHASKLIARLADLGYLDRVAPVEVAGTAPARAFLRIADQYLRFWFRNVLPNTSALERGRIDEVTDSVLDDLPAFAGRVFEECCREWIGRYSALGAAATRVGAWWSRRGDAEIDVVAADERQVLVVGSCKWAKRPVGPEAVGDLVASRTLLGARASGAALVLFARVGVDPRARERADRDGVLVVTAADLFA